MVRFLVVVALVVPIAACQATSVAAPAPTPVAAVHAAVASTILRQSDLPAGLAPCSGAAYPTGAQRSSLQAMGAQDVAVTLFAADPAACSAELAASGSTRSAASIVIAFADEGEADRAWQQGVLGFAPPAPGEVPPGITRGTGTGLGPSSWSYSRGAVRLACWRKSVFVAVVVFTNLDPASFKTATAAVDARLN